MKNIFSKTTENRTQNGVKSYSFPTRLLYTISIFTFLTLGFGQAWADITYSGGHIYFDNSLGIDDNTLQICARQVKSDGGTYTGVSSLSNISNTKLYYVANPQGSNWGNIAGWVVISANPAKSNSNFDNWSDYTWCSGWNTYGFNSGSTYLIVPSSKDKNQSVTTTYCDGGYGAIPKYNATQGAKWRDAGTSYAITTGTYPATLKLQGTYLSGNGKSARSTITSTASTDGDAKKVYGAVVTGEITHSFESLNSSYYFEGWGTGSTPSSTENTYSYNISENTTTYAFFSKTYTLTYDRKGTFGNSTLSVDVSNFSGTKESGSAIPTGHQITFTATPASGYVIEGWYSDAECTKSLDNGQNTTYTISSLDAAKSVYVKFEQLKTITIKIAHEVTAGWTIQGVSRYPESGGQRISANGKWVTIEFTNVYAVSNIDLAYSGGDWDYLKTDTKITGDCCYNKDGSLNASCCVSAPSLTWTTAPADGHVDEHMTAVVNTTPVSGGSPRVTWYTSNSNIADVNESTGVISYKAAGSATITARVTWSATGDYCAGSSDLAQTITVSAPSQEPVLGAVTATPSGQPNYAQPPIDFELSVTSTYLAHPVVVFFVNDGTTTYEVVGTPYGAEGNSAAGTIGTGPVYTTVHKATFTASAAKTYTVSAKLYEGELIDNFEGENTRGWAGDNLGNGSMTFTNNPVKMTVNGSNKVMQVTRTGGADWGGAIMLFVDKNAKATCDAAGSNDYAYIHARMKDATDATHLKNNDNASDGNDNDILPSFDGETSSDWRHVTYHNTHCSNNFLFFMIQRGNPEDKTVYIDDIILSNEETMTEKATAAAPASFSINTVTLNNNDATTPGTESVIVTYGSALSNITVPSKTDYTFYGYYTENAGEGRQLINDAGEWIASVDGYTDEDKKWIHDGDVTLYAYYKKAQITRITFSPGNIVAPGAEVGVTATVEPTPVEPTTICWRVLYSNDNPLAPQPKFTPAEAQGNSVSFKAPEASGSYKVEATLRKGTGCGGEEIHTFTAPFQVAGDHTVTVQYKCGNTTIKASTSATGKPLEWTAITAPEIVGYSFLKWVEGDGITIEGATNGEKADATINFQAIYDGKLTAVYTSRRMIYFNNTLGWKGVTVYFYKNASYWNNDNGAGADNTYEYTNKPYSDGKHGDMTQIEGTKIWYFDLDANNVPANLTTVNFTELNQHGYGYFAETAGVKNNVAHPCNNAALFNVNMPMYVPIDDGGEWKNGGRAKYYVNGYWMCYPNYSGYTLKIYNTDNRNTEPTAIKSFDFPYSDGYVLPMSVDVDLEANKKYYFDVYRNDNTLFGNNGDMKYGDSGPWSFFNTDTRRAGITTTAAGNYRFTWSFFKESSTYNYHMTVTYPVGPNDYRVIYTDNATWTKAHTAHTWIHPSRIIRDEENAKDTISFFVSKGHSPEFKIQQVSSINEETGAITWTDVTDWTSCDDVDASGVYNFIFSQYSYNQINYDKKEPYTGNFYIRTDAANSKWDNYRSDPDHLMTYSEYSITHGGYSHYYCHWVPIANAARKNIKFCIANDYSPCISDTLARETASGEWTNINSFIDEHGNLQRSSNVRFMWNQSTNKVSRAYLDPSTNDNNFLVLESADSKIANQNEVVQSSVVFSDNENWIYEANVKAKPNAQIKLKATWGDAPTIVQYFKGTESTTETLITGSTDNWYDIRLIYDFKTNRLIAAMLPSGNHTTSEPINADVMFIREHQGDIEPLTFTGDGALTDIKIAYGVMRFNKWTLNNREKTGDHIPLVSPASIYERAMYFISFPFEVKLSEVFGFGTYGQDWIIEYYDGAERARTGWWDGQPGFWRYVWDRKNFVLKPNVGYLLELELGNFKEGSGFWNNKNERLELFFPSSGPLGSITNASVTQTLPAHKCDINRAETEGLPDTPDPSTSYNRTVFDSHWNIMSVPTYVNVDDPSFANTTWIANESCPTFLYTWNMNDNTLTATSGKGFMYHAMHAYTVQYYGNVTWTTSVTPTAAPQRNTEYRGEYEFCLEVQQDDQMIDRTFVRLSDDENVTTGFEFSEDMTKQFNSRKANIFTIAGNTSLGGNSLPLSTTQTTVVPVGVKIKTAGDYTFSIPEGTEGIGVTLVDNETGVRTLLSALDYTVNLTAGTHDGRFVLEISPIQNTPTGIEEPTSDSSLKGRAQKRIIDGVLYIVKDGKIFDARGTRVE